MPESKAPRARRIDPVGQLLVSVGFASLIYAVIEGPRRGWSSAVILGLFALFACALLGLVSYEPRRTEPLLDLRFFGSIPFASATVIAVLMFGAFSGFGFLNALYLQEVRGMPAFLTGVYTLPLALATIAASPVSGRLIGRFGTRPSLLISGSAVALSGLLLTRLGPDTALSRLVLAYVIFGIGFGLVNAPITNTAVSGMPRAQAGLAAAVASTSRLFGASLGVAIGGTLAHGHHAQLGFTQATHPFFWLVTGAGVAVAALGLLSNGNRAKASMRRVAGLLDEPNPGSVALGIES